MEFIANLERSQTSKGLTPENLENLEKIFHNTVGDKNEIDLESFKKVVQSKNMFFLWSASSSPVEKLKYLFDVYDINNDGNIEFNELRNVISECMKENGLQFGESETDELTRMLFEDADTDGSGTITFTEFKNQLERQPAFMENLTLSIERWLLPPMETKKSRPTTGHYSRKKISWRHIRNNWTHVVFLLVYFMINFVLFVTRGYEYRESNVYVILARACGQCLNFNCTFIVVLVLRQTLTCLWHTTMHIVNFSILSSASEKSLLEWLTSTHLGIGWVGGAACLTGWILLFILIVMCVSAMPFVRRSGKFEVFYYLHLLSFVFWICLILHGPNFWKWFLGPAVLFLMECFVRVNRNLSSSKLAYVQQGVLLPSKVTHLVIKRPPKFDYRPGDYVYINIPSIANFEWHPFTISSAPEMDDVMWLHIRGVGEWTNSLYNYFQREDREAVLSDELAKNFRDLASMSINDSILSSAFIRHSSCVESPPGIDCPKNCSLLSATLNDGDKTFVCQSPHLDDSDGAVKQSTFNFRHALGDATFYNNSFFAENPMNQTVIEMERNDTTYSISNRDSDGSFAANSLSVNLDWRRTSFTSFSASRAIQKKNKEDIRNILAEHNRLSVGEDVFSNASRLSVKSRKQREKRKSVRVSVAKHGLRRCQTVIVMPTVNEDEEEDVKLELDKIHQTEEEVKDLKREVEVENVIVSQEPLRIFLDGPYGSPTRHIFQARHAVLIATGIGVTPFASILQSRTTEESGLLLVESAPALFRVVREPPERVGGGASPAEGERPLPGHPHVHHFRPAQDGHEGCRAADGLGPALQKGKARSHHRAQKQNPAWQAGLEQGLFTSIAEQQKGKVTVFFCGPNQLAKTLQIKCDEFGFRFRKEIF
ncbi:NADPH oxidase 5 [Caerostris extrusa]|uniref:NADPH oxidase 5 n=1 Tax=Caerostris extrusa TaxID=172846 RepID=A0AAV4P582_CAEEX|nr:NADPH oxidase 5 [Caerostris extrusa]